MDLAMLDLVTVADECNFVVGVALLVVIACRKFEFHFPWTVTVIAVLVSPVAAFRT